jgi:hypothetical protein
MPLATMPSTIKAARFSSAGSCPAALRWVASANIGGSSCDSDSGVCAGVAAVSCASCVA